MATRISTTRRAPLAGSAAAVALPASAVASADPDAAIIRDAEALISLEADALALSLRRNALLEETPQRLRSCVAAYRDDADHMEAVATFETSFRALCLERGDHDTRSGHRSVEQFVITGAERIGERELAERRMAEPMRARKPQRPADDGLFDVAGRKQGRLS